MQVRKKETKWSPISAFTLLSFLFVATVVARAQVLEEEMEMVEEEEDFNEMRLELIHRHDPRIPGNYKLSNVSRFEQIKELARRDILRRQRLFQRWDSDLLDADAYPQRRKNWEIIEMPMHAGLHYGIGEYFVEVKIGTPAHSFWLIADLGSDLTWVRCKYCTGNCQTHRRRKRRNRSNRSSSRVFNANRSRTFQPVTCSSKRCKFELLSLYALPTDCSNPSDPCRYIYRYFDGSAAGGLFGSETITVGHANGKKRKLKNVLIGCTKNTSEGSTFNERTDGVLGLSLSRESFLMKAAIEYGGKFSYCLVDHLSPQNVSNYLSFGGHRNPKTTFLGEIRETQLIIDDPFMGLNVLGLSAGGQMLKIPSETWNFLDGGGLIMDSGQSLTFLTTPAYEPLMNVLLKVFENLDTLEEDYSPFEYCYNSTEVDESSIPRLAFHLEGGSRFEPPVKSYVVDASPYAKCIGITPATWPGYSTLGNIMQQNHFWEFDLSLNTVAYAPSTCT
ncbi:hypothetical protein L6164_018078 [Bauhinia variegata]|uniref:Uncharacterized protein n=1 Tax=Bauhinia variegata TaxID=167791 RepID=A0ACB9NC16_BAUVA|nr:hypothetical protein L6164_018078 [Bauhinia variegata]